MSLGIQNMDIRVAGTMVARSSSVRVIACLKSHLYTCMWGSDRLRAGHQEVDLRECALHSPPQKANKTKPTVAFNPRRDVTRNSKQGYQ